MGKIADGVYELVRDTVESQGVMLWDVAFVKEGASRYLRIFIDKEGGVSIDDCVNVSHAVDPIIDEADPISESYCLEVCSPGLERELTRPEHFKTATGKAVTVKLFKPIDGKKELSGILGGLSEDCILLSVDGVETEIKRADAARVRLKDF